METDFYQKILKKSLERSSSLIEKMLLNEVDYRPNPAIELHKNCKPRPYSIDDFKKKYFITNLIQKEEEE